MTRIKKSFVVTIGSILFALQPMKIVKSKAINAMYLIAKIVSAEAPRQDPEDPNCHSHFLLFVIHVNEDL